MWGWMDQDDTLNSIIYQTVCLILIKYVGTTSEQIGKQCKNYWVPKLHCKTTGGTSTVL